jgi:hypothetical protein
LHSAFTSSKLIAGLGIFWIFAALMAALAGVSLEWRGTPLDKMWVLNKQAYAVLSPVASIVGPLFLVFSALMVFTSIGWLKRRLWSWRLAIAVLGTQIVGDIANLVHGDLLRGGTGVVIASALLLLVVRRELRSQFS